jgi:hypothetical protein
MRALRHRAFVPVELLNPEQVVRADVVHGAQWRQGSDNSIGADRCRHRVLATTRVPLASTDRLTATSRSLLPDDQS